MKSEVRIIKSSFYAGVLDILLGIFMYLIGYQHFYMHGVIGVGMMFYGMMHYYFYRREMK